MGNVSLERSCNMQRLDAKSSVSSDGRLLGSLVGDVSSTTKIGIQASYDVFKSSLQACGAIRVTGDNDQIGCGVFGETALRLLFHQTAKTHSAGVQALVRSEESSEQSSDWMSVQASQVPNSSSCIDFRTHPIAHCFGWIWV